jgi:hypothetical protein
MEAPTTGRSTPASRVTPSIRTARNTLQPPILPVGAEIEPVRPGSEPSGPGGRPAGTVRPDRILRNRRFRAGRPAGRPAENPSRRPPRRPASRSARR